MRKEGSKRSVTGISAYLGLIKFMFVECVVAISLKHNTRNNNGTF